MPEETQVLSVDARRMGRDRRPCRLIAGHHGERYVVLRGEDVSGTASIVALMEPGDARTLARALVRAADIVQGIA